LLRRVDQHAFHVHSLAVPVRETGTPSRRQPTASAATHRCTRNVENREGIALDCRRSVVDQASGVGACVAATAGGVRNRPPLARKPAAPGVAVDSTGESIVRGGGVVWDVMRVITGRGAAEGLWRLKPCVSGP
jgi:hypothetical protein